MNGRGDFLDIKNSVFLAANSIDDKKGKDIEILKVDGLSTLADYFVIATGTSSTHINAIAQGVLEDMEKSDLDLHHREGKKGQEWILLDYGDVVIHIFSKQEREFYDIERIWGDAQNLELNIDTL